MINAKFLCVAVVALSLGGCGAFSGARPTQVTDESGETWQVSRVNANLSPQETMRRATNACKRLKLTPPKAGGFFSGDPDPNNWPIQSDYFSAKAGAQTIAGERIELLAAWQDNNKSQLTVRSKLVENQHVRLIGAIREELDKPAAER